jgi:glycosyltransferase involved in cell wall biosynthesis
MSRPNTIVETPLITVALPAFKAKYFRQAIDSILRQTYSHFELIIVNDASPEDLTSIVESYKDERIQYYVNEKNIGSNNLVDNWNLCLSYAKGEYFVLASDDDIYHPEFLEEMYALSLRYPNVDLFHCRLQVIDNDDNVIAVSSPCLEYESDLDFINQRATLRRSQRAHEFMSRTHALRNIGGFVAFPLGWCSDNATWFSLAKGKGVAYSSRCLFSWRCSGINISSCTNNTAQKIEAASLYKKWVLGHVKTIAADGAISECLKRNIVNGAGISTNAQIVNDLVASDLKVFLSILCNRRYHKVIPLKSYLKAIVYRCVR